MGVQFEEQYVPKEEMSYTDREAGLTGFFLRTKIAKNKNQAIAILLGMGAALIGVSFFIFIKYVLPPRYTLSADERAAADRRVQEIDRMYQTPRTNIR